MKITFDGKNRGSGLGPTITFKEALVKYGLTKGVLSNLLAREDAPKQKLHHSNSSARVSNTYYNAKEFDKWIKSLKL